MECSTGKVIYVLCMYNHALIVTSAGVTVSHFL